MISARKDGDCKVEAFLLRRDSLQVPLVAMVSHLLVVRNFLMMMRERLEQHHGHSAASYFHLESMLSSSAFRFVHNISRFLNDEVCAHRARLSSMVASASDSLVLDSKFVVEFIRTAERGSTVSVAAQKLQGRPLTCP